MNYYNEWDSGAAAWLRELINKKLIPNGYVDERSITEVTPSDLEGFTQCHFFAGIGGWPLALQLAGVPASTRLWTGSPPCQPFSVAGQSLGFDDERHLAPVLLRLVRECKPQYFFGEQVAAAIRKHWLDFVFLNLEDKGYSCGAAVLPACSVGAPHKRDRLFFGAFQLADNDSRGCWQGGESGAVDAVPQHRKNNVLPSSERNSYSSMADTDSEQWGRSRVYGAGMWTEPANGSSSGRLGNTALLRSCIGNNGGVGGKESKEQGEAWERYGEANRATGADVHCGPANPYNGFWSDADWLGCRDGKFRPVESGTFPLANGIPARVGRLRGYGNAIVPQVAAEFITAFMGAAGETLKD